VRERTILTIVLLTFVIITIGYVVATNVDLMPTAASSRAVLVDRLARILVGIATVVFLLVEGALIYAVLRFRRKPGDEGEAEPIHGNTTLEIIWTIIPAFIVIFIGFYSFQILTDIETPGSNELIVEVTGQQFVWSFRYPQYDRTTPELRLPVDRPVRFEITSLDVIHSFWVPAFRAKRDATPGQVSQLLITPTELGTFPIRCAELCGAGHATMVSTVSVVSEDEFNTWIESLASGQPPGPPPAEEHPEGEVEEPETEGDGQPPEEEMMAAGRDLFWGMGCAGCHTLDDAGSTGVVGPILDGIAERAGGYEGYADAHDYIMNSIADPNSFIVEGYPASMMPQNFEARMTPEELHTIIEYLMHQ
jgi:cytochrome c oxidase subunit 2